MLIKLKHILAFALLGAFLNLWVPADVILDLHTHEHTVHNHEEDGISFDNLHHHCAFLQFSVLPHTSPAFLLGKSFIRFISLNPSFLTPHFTFPLLGNALSRGPPEELKS